MMLKIVMLLDSLYMERLKDKSANLFGLVVSDEEKSFIILTPGGNVIKNFLYSMMRTTVS
jgi:hypothetical protein